MDIIIVTAGVLLHIAAGAWAASPWMLPDLSLIGLTLVLARSSQPTPVRPILLVSWLAMCFTARHAVVAAMSYLGAGWLIRVLASRWEVRQGTLPLLILGLAEAALLGLWLLLIGPRPSAPFLMVSMRWAVTLGCGWLLFSFVPPRWRSD